MMRDQRSGTRTAPGERQRGSMTRAEDEDREDEALFRARMAELDAASGGELPAEIGDRVLKGDSLLVAICSWRGMTSTQVAHRANLTPDDIAALESGQALDEPIALRVAAALGVDPTWIGRL